MVIKEVYQRHRLYLEARMHGPNMARLGVLGVNPNQNKNNNNNTDNNYINYIKSNLPPPPLPSGQDAQQVQGVLGLNPNDINNNNKNRKVGT